MNTIYEIWRLVNGIWGANKQDIRGIIRLALVILVLWPVGAFCIAMLGHEIAFALMSYWGIVLAIPLVILAWQFPVVSSFATGIGYTRNLLRDLCLVIGTELVVGIYCAWVPLAENRVLALALVLISLALFFLLIGTQVKWNKKVIVFLWLMFFGITDSFFFDWPGYAQEWFSQPNELKEIPALFREGGHFEDGLYINPQNTTVQKYAKMENKLVWTGNDGEFLYTCDKDMKVTNVGPHQTVEITHVMKRVAKYNRCSYSYTGDYYPVYGAVGQIAQPKFRNDIPFPDDFPLYSVVFQLRKQNGDLVMGYIRNEGGKDKFTNESDAPAELWVIYNYMKSFQNEQVGWDGSSSTFKIKVTS